MSVELCGLRWKNPVTTASGTFSARDSGGYYDFSRLGAVTTKGVSAEAWRGNPVPRIAESWGGMLNAVGLENPGVEAYIKEEIPYIKHYINERLMPGGERMCANTGGDGSEAGTCAAPETLIIANIVGKHVDEYRAVAERLNETDADMLEMNISCPNIKAGGLSFGTDARLAAEVTAAVRAATAKPLIVKLTPNVTDICEIAKAAEDAGADAVSLINTLLGMRIDAKKRMPTLANITGGLSGPAIKPIALRMVYQTARAVNIPIIGMGGIMTGEDAAEFFMAGASAVAVGTAALICPTAPTDILSELEEFMQSNGFADIGALRTALG
jgi:dihydroorotate dehydrogenase (NAD+) catalytic subunit